jgi:hypothetical protein
MDNSDVKLVERADQSTLSRALIQNGHAGTADFSENGVNLRERSEASVETMSSSEIERDII